MFAKKSWGKIFEITTLCTLKIFHRKFRENNVWSKIVNWFDENFAKPKLLKDLPNCVDENFEKPKLLKNSSNCIDSETKPLLL